MSDEMPPPLPPEDDRFDMPTIKGLRTGDTVLGRFKLANCLGRGGMGEVWQAHDSTLGEDVALKLLPRLISTDDVAIDDLKNETRRGRQLSHPNIVRVFDFYQDEQNVAIAMELVPGENLSRLRMQQPGQVFSTEALTPWVIQLLSALDYAHRTANVVHRDLKPANLLIHTTTRALKVADFGIARCLAESLQRSTLSVQSRGTLCYMSPEQAVGRGANFIDDLYAVGATLYELLAGSPPFYQGDVYTQIQKVPPQPLAQRLAENRITTATPPAHWEAAILRCLAKQRADRPQSAGELAEMLGLHGVASTQPYIISSDGAAAASTLLPPPVPTPAAPTAQPSPSSQHAPAHTGSISISTSAPIISVHSAEGHTQRSFVDLTRTQSSARHTTQAPVQLPTLPPVPAGKKTTRWPYAAAAALALAAVGTGSYYLATLKSRSPQTSTATIVQNEGPPPVPYGVEATISLAPETKLPPAGETWKVPSAYFATLEAAISLAPAGTKIEIGEHRWTERIVIDKDLHLVGKSQEQTQISVDGRKGAALGITAGKKVILENITFQHVDADVATSGAPLVHVENTQATFKNCRFTRSIGHGLEVAAQADITAENCSFDQNHLAGASVLTAGKLSLKSCNLTGNNVAVSAGGDQAKLHMQGGLVQGNATTGIELTSSAYAELSQVKIQESGSHGILAQSPGTSLQATSVTVEKCKIGTQIETGATAVLKDCKHDSNEVGVGAVDSGAITLSGGSASQNSTHGIAIQAQGKAGTVLISGMKVKSNAIVGLLLSGAEVKPDVANNTFGPNGQVDVLGLQQATGHFSKNTLHTGPDYKAFDALAQWDADNTEVAPAP